MYWISYAGITSIFPALMTSTRCLSGPGTWLVSAAEANTQLQNATNPSLDYKYPYSKCNNGLIYSKKIRLIELILGFPHSVFT